MDDLITFEATSEQRVGLALWLNTMQWSGDEMSLLLADEVSEAFGLEEVPVKPVLNGNGQVVHFSFAGGPPAERLVHLRKEVAEFLLRAYPPAPTPAAVGRDKVKLLRALRAMVNHLYAAVEPSNA